MPLRTSCGPPPRLTAAVILLSALLGAGCYHAIAVAPSSLAPGTSVRLYLNPAGTAQLAPRLGPETIRIDGRLEAVGPDGLGVVVSRTAKSFGGEVPWLGERVTVPANVVAHVERRALDRRRTLTVAIVSALAAAAGLVALIVQGGGGSGSDGSSGPGGPSP